MELGSEGASRETGGKGCRVGRRRPRSPSPGGLGSRDEFGAAACAGGSGGSLPRSRRGEPGRGAQWAGGDPPSHPGPVLFAYPRSHRGSARSRSPVVPASAPRATRSRCPGGTWREAESWAEVSSGAGGREWGGSEDWRPHAQGLGWASPSSVAQRTRLWGVHRCGGLGFDLIEHGGWRGRVMLQGGGTCWRPSGCRPLSGPL